LGNPDRSQEPRARINDLDLIHGHHTGQQRLKVAYIGRIHDCAEYLFQATWKTSWIEMGIHTRVLQSTSPTLSTGLEKSCRLLTKGGLNEHLGRH